jgi:hypothetical protein
VSEHVKSDAAHEIFDIICTQLASETTRQQREANDATLVPHFDIYQIASVLHPIFLEHKVSTSWEDTITITQELKLPFLESTLFAEPPETYPEKSMCLAQYFEDMLWYPATIKEVMIRNYRYRVIFHGYNNEQDCEFQHLAPWQHAAPEEKPKEHKEDKGVDKSVDKGATKVLSLREKLAVQESQQKQKSLHHILGNENDDAGVGVKTKRHVNKLMEVHEVPEDFEEKMAEKIKTFEKWELQGSSAEALDIDDELKDEDMDEHVLESILMVGDHKINPKMDICCMCERTIPLTWHHLIPRETHQKMRKLHPDYTKEFLHQHGIWICRSCHSAVHGFHDNFALASEYFTLERLLECEKVQKWIKYISKKKVRSGHDVRLKNGQNRIAKLRAVEAASKQGKKGKGPQESDVTFL